MSPEEWKLFFDMFCNRMISTGFMAGRFDAYRGELIGEASPGKALHRREGGVQVPRRTGTPSLRGIPGGVDGRTRGPRATGPGEAR